MKDKLKKYLLPNLPYLFFVYLFDKLCQAVRLADYFVPPYSFRYPYYNLNGAFWPHLRILQKKNAMNYLFIAFLTPYSIFSLAVCSCIQ